MSKMFDLRNGPGRLLSPREPKASETAGAEWSTADATARLAWEGLSSKSGECDQEADP